MNVISLILAIIAIGISVCSFFFKKEGPKGETGPKGDKGERGERGMRGFIGETGPKGDKGDKGEIGPKGLNGKDAILNSDELLFLLSNMTEINLPNTKIIAKTFNESKQENNDVYDAYDKYDTLDYYNNSITDFYNF